MAASSNYNVADKVSRHIGKSNFNSPNTDSSFTMADSDGCTY